MRRRERKALAAELVSGTEAFLLGRYAEHAAARGPVPVWAWTNLLAHGDEPALRAEVAAVAHPGTLDWRGARAILAAELLAAAGPDCPLYALQAAVLAPLELSLADRPAVGHWERRTWMETVRAALRAHRPTHQS